MRDIPSPAVYLVAKTSLVHDGLNAYLRDIGSPDWTPDAAVSDGENLIEAAGRMCYRSWQAYDPEKPEATNPNVRRVREGNEAYIGNVLRQAHGSILEHVNLTFIFRGVSRVVTHELVRHRVGMAYSQESLRYVRLDDLPFWLPEAARDDDAVERKFRDVVAFLESVQTDLGTLFGIEDLKDFTTKKHLTSMFRRLAPMGIGTTIMVTGNLRSWRHIIAIRTAGAAEEEIRIVGSQVAAICKREYPHAFQDMEQDDETGEWTFANMKV
ncbi:MAG: FAD-dependent thymidylate synthase [Lentisphaerae bacterium]|mgnify:FL=1|jgi:thymidylate synthase (FAD)|nr:FAD-dependent thymidylate synthase [Lentisphaerota bacterium]MBT4821614.1 FAD-dependent thymidylate synthase [Lentisphaerota bacterium]MBT5611432.1 FAD-dependent thymidylate synthase [Lentisphaerota bacterium]MBT7059661.1 FAD-dependent thymidylate synthase [Lentisphaerota bacterium]MBT7846889.1 FAD-dependent thymidylate synthase [Lentisphaerota bacterium]